MKRANGVIMILVWLTLVLSLIMAANLPKLLQAAGGYSLNLPMIMKPESETNPEFCPPFTESSLVRPRTHQLVLSPADDWQSAIEDAAADTEILLTPGTYLNDRTVWMGETDDITIRGSSGNRDDVLIQGEGYQTGIREGFAFGGRNISIADLSMTGIRNHAISVKSHDWVEAPHIYNVHLYDIGTQHVKGSGTNGLEDGIVACSAIGYTEGGVQGDYLNGVDIHGANNWIVRDNYFYNIFGDGSGCEVDVDCGTYLRGGGPVILLWNNARDNLVERNIMVDSFRGVAFGLGSGHDGGIVRNNFFFQAEAAREVPFGPPISGDMGIQLQTTGQVMVEHNTIILGGDYPGAIEAMNSSGHVTIRNNLITRPVWDRGSAGFSDNGNITDATVADLLAAGAPHIPANSRAVGAGVTSSLDHDIDGDARNGRWDVGADQVVPRENPCPP